MDRESRFPAPWNSSRLGFILPSANAVFEPEVGWCLPRTVTAHFSRVRCRRDTQEEIYGMIDHVPRAAAELSDARVQVISFACTSGSFVGGADYDVRVCNLIEGVTRTPAVTTSGAVVAALHRLELSKIALLTPYEAWINQKEVEFLAAHGIEVLVDIGLGLPEPNQIEGVSAAEIWDAVRRLDRPEVEGVFVSCTDLPVLALIGDLEAELGKPIVSSNQATLWASLRAAGCSIPIAGFGQLLRLP